MPKENDTRGTPHDSKSTVNLSKGAGCEWNVRIIILLNAHLFSLLSLSDTKLGKHARTVEGEDKDDQRKRRGLAVLHSCICSHLFHLLILAASFLLRSVDDRAKKFTDDSPFLSKVHTLRCSCCSACHVCTNAVRTLNFFNLLIIG